MRVLTEGATRIVVAKDSFGKGASSASTSATLKLRSTNLNEVPGIPCVSSDAGAV
eukprot:SAG31_NODE_5574_length_2448_cov_3.162197_3_plen_55_part_00